MVLMDSVLCAQEGCGHEAVHLIPSEDPSSAGHVWLLLYCMPLVTALQEFLHKRRHFASNFQP